MTVTPDDYLVAPFGNPARQHTLPALFDAVANRLPDTVAVLEAGDARTWSHWRAASYALAAALQESGIGTGDVVAVQLPNCWEFLVTHVAVAELGAVLLPLHLALGEREAESLLIRARARILIRPAGHPNPGHATDRISPARLPALERILFVGPEPDDGHTRLDELMNSHCGSLPRPVAVTPDLPFVLMPSSGTTSERPKLCLHAHSGLLANAEAVARQSLASHDDVLISASPFTHLFGLLSVHLSLFTGGRQALLPHWDVAAFGRLARNSAASVLFAVPAQLRDALRSSSGQLGTLREVRTGGAAVPAELVARVRAVLGATTVVQWGMSELGAGTTTGPDDPAEVVARSIGRPVPGAQARVAGPDGKPCPDGETGELHYRSPYSFRGYLDDPQATRAAFTPDGWLRTGDRARRNPDGTFSYQGRDAELINVGGLKFTASEVETVLSGLPQPQALAVAARADDRLGEYPVLLAALREGHTLELAQVHARLAETGVAPYKWPLELLIVDRIPVTPTGKVARARLAPLLVGPTNTDPAPMTSPTQAALDEALSQVEAEVAAVTGRPANGTADSRTPFRELGLDSAGAVQLAARLSALTGQRLPSTAAFDHPSPWELAHRMVAGPNRHATPEAPHPRPLIPAAGDDPVVITGIGCRFPGGIDTPESLWQLLAAGQETVGGFPQDRGWDLARLHDPEPGRAGRTTARGGSFLTGEGGAGAFDPAFFALSPREALGMDPQQRLLLETGWEALERAGIDPAGLRGKAAGVYLGLMASDYAPRLSEAPELYDGHLLIGNAPSVASGRLAYLLGLTGPALTVDTACSSSLVALHLAVQALHRGEVDLALTGGATVMATPASFVDFARQRALSPDGRCRAFAADADGAGWGEGAAVLVLERLSDARAHGHPVLAVVSGSAVNQDGASNGLTAPSGPAQQQVIRLALVDAALTADQIDVVEAHGTGTPLGDRVEADALRAVFGPGRPREHPLRLGSVKSNIGHTQAAAGVAGVIKMVLALQHGLLPRTLHVDSSALVADLPQPADDAAERAAVHLLHGARPWPVSARPRRAGISAFGISGTNAHVILTEPPPVPPADVNTDLPVDPAVPWLLSARSDEALRAAAQRLAAATGMDTSAGPAAIGAALARSRSSFEHRAVVVGRHRGELHDGLVAVASGRWSADVVQGRSTGQRGGTVFVFPGQGAQWPGMAADLLDAFPVFARSVEECERALAPHLDFSLASVLRGGTGAPPLERDDVAQPALFAVMVSLAALWRSFGVHPDAVVGHSQGEIAAAHVCGALPLAQAARIVAVRARAVRQLAPGRMAAVGLPARELADRLARRSGLALAAENSPRSTVVAGDATAVEEFVAELTEHGVRARMLPVGYASHCAAVEPLEEALTASLAGVGARPGSVPFFSTVEPGPGPLDCSRLDARYWYRNLRQPVRLRDTIQSLLHQGHRRFIEIGPHPVLSQAVEETAEAAGVTATTVGTLRQAADGPRQFLLSAARAQVGGAPVDWTAAFTGVRREHIDLPTYPFQRQQYWLTTHQRPGRVGAEAPPTPEPGPRQPDDQDLLALVLTHTAAVLGHPTGTRLPADAAFQELGTGSMAAVELRSRLSRTLGIALSATAVFDHPTPALLAAHLRGRQQRTASAGPAADLPDGLDALYRHACHSGRGTVAADLLRTASRLRLSFDGDAGVENAPAAVRLPGGPDGRAPVLLCVPSVLPTGGPHEYAQLARCLPGWETAVLPLPGFAAGERVPDSALALVTAHAEGTLRYIGSRPVLLCGHSSGGLLAQALAQHLASLGRPAAGLVQLDAPWPEHGFVTATLPAVLALLEERQRPGSLAAEPVNPTRLTATGAYLRLLDGLTDGGLDGSDTSASPPTLLLRAERPLDGIGALAARWPLPHTRVDVPGDHFTMLTEDAASTAQAIDSWARPGPPPRPAPAKEPTQ
ncbi:beta-ketoacyl synthase N-terminal-like domain-containing protein [Kitasatospora sp. NPDC094028]